MWPRDRTWAAHLRMHVTPQAAIQRSLEGLTRSLGKELKKGSNAQLVYVSEGAEDQIESTMRFLISPRSAYVSAQVIRIRKAVGPSVAPADWAQSLAGKKVLVTGASRGIGAAIAEVMAREGAHVICTGRASGASWTG
jgi:3-oxoacyl-[acyl-carrier protein] reductase